MDVLDIVRSRKRRPVKKPLNNVVQSPKYLFPLESDVHFELNKLMIANKDLFSNTHYQWLIDQVVNDATENKVLEIIDHVQKVITSLKQQVVYPPQHH